MAETLQEALLAPDVRPNVIADAVTLVEEEVSEKGLIIKGAYKTVTAFASNIVKDVIDALLPDFLEKLQPYWVDFAANGGGSFGDYLAGRGAEVSEALLSVTDARAANSERAPLRKAYNAVRPSGVKNVESALPRLGALVQKYAG
ncbi:hypothetical protein KDL01_31080 [Actinospica durhamensis]|uniref:Uncharacterized protein n=1 Tax=Actinospica durhamensis TaxID=1508375 RepID=A0A941EU87_9ACTN|nr:hypothetical protein [Actinospica durhamensis]MBR7837760.1 hypothetical protein [Actinospica durhamensis]